jgi:L-fuconolactonase
MALDLAGAYRYPNPHADWLETRIEEILEPDRPIIDAHHHIWEQEGNVYLLDDFACDLGSGHKIEATTFVQAHFGYRPDGPVELRCVGETEKIELIARDAEERNLPTRVAAAAFADLTVGSDVIRVIEAHRQAAPTRLRGIRHSVSHDTHFPEGIVLRPAPPRLLSEPRYRAGLKALAGCGLSYDAMLYHQQIPELAETARALPELPIVVDHFGTVIGVGPYRRRQKETFQIWRRDIRELARSSNVFCKLGGMGMIICGAEWHERPSPPSSAELARAWRPYFDTCVEAFGAERCMFESNFPVDKAMFSYSVLWNAFKRLASGASETEKDRLFRSTAASFYRVPIEPEPGRGR